MTTPNDMPTKPGLRPVHALILADLIATTGGTRNHKVIDAVSGDVVTVQIPVAPAPRYPLARNVSERSIERAARRWAA